MEKTLEQRIEQMEIVHAKLIHDYNEICGNVKFLSNELLRTQDRLTSLEKQHAVLAESDFNRLKQNIYKIEGVIVDVLQRQTSFDNALAGIDQVRSGNPKGEERGEYWKGGSLDG